MITIESTDEEIRVIIPRGEMELGQVEAILRPFRFASLVAGSQMSKEEACGGLEGGLVGEKSAFEKWPMGKFLIRLFEW